MYVSIQSIAADAAHHMEACCFSEGNGESRGLSQGLICGSAKSVNFLTLSVSILPSIAMFQPEPDRDGATFPGRDPLLSIPGVYICAHS